MFWLFFELTLVCISIALIINFVPENGIRFIAENMNSNFENKVLVWIIGYGTLYMLLVLRRCLFIWQWIYMEDPRYVQKNCDCLTFVFLNTFEFAWFIYGNSFFWSENGIKHEEKLWQIMLAILIYGYINMLCYFLACCGIFTLLFMFYSGGFIASK